jgi:hypothetical protein
MTKNMASECRGARKTSSASLETFLLSNPAFKEWNTIDFSSSVSSVRERACYSLQLLTLRHVKEIFEK